MSSTSSSPSPVSAISGSAPPHVVEDCMGIVQLLSDGTVTRSSDYSHLPILRHVPSDLPVQWKDVVYDANRGLRLRMYMPTAHSVGSTKLPVLAYFHGGGFCIASFEWPNFHAGALRLAGELPAIVLSADYRLAPEHRLPAAYEDAEDVLSWLRDQVTAGADADPWLAESADFGRVFVCGDSAGGNIAHHVAVRLGSGDLVLGQLRVAGCVVLWPFFGGKERTASESEALAVASSDFDPGKNFDQMWRLALPVGATRDHPAANPFGPDSIPLDGVQFPPVLVAKSNQDRMRDRVAEYVARLRAMGKPVELAEFEGQGHGFFVFEPFGKASDELIQVVKRFVYNG